MKRRAVVHVSPHAPQRGRPRFWAYSYRDLGILFGMTPEAVRRAVSDGRVDPSNLASVVAFANARRVRGELLRPSA